VEESIYNNLEETIEIESSEASEKISQLEKQDKELLDTVISFNEEELDKIKDKADEAIKVNEDLKEALNEEETNFKEAKEKYEKKLGLEMYVVMMNRYDTYDKLSDIYDKAIEEKIDFYNLMKEEDVKEETILEQVEVVNKNNEEIINLNNKMNEYTETY